MKRTQQQNKELELILNFLGINFGGKKLPEVTLYTCTGFTSVI